MKIRAIITGTTGMVGKGVLIECLEHPDVETVLVINRKTINLTPTEVKDFTSLSCTRVSIALEVVISVGVSLFFIVENNTKLIANINACIVIKLGCKLPYRILFNSII